MKTIMKLMLLVPAVKKLVEERDEARRAKAFAETAMEAVRKGESEILKALQREREEATKQVVVIERLKRDVTHAQSLTATAEDKYLASRRELAEVQRTRNIAWPRPERRLEDKELLERFDVEMEDELWQAVHQVLDDVTGAALDAATARGVSSEDRAYLAGQAESLREFQSTLLGWQRRAQLAAGRDLAA